MRTTRGHATRTRIVDAALQVLRERGSAGLTMRRVSEAADMSLSNLQYYYGSREALLGGVTEHHLGLCQDALARGLEDVGEVTLATVLHVSLCNEGVRDTVPAFRELFALARYEEEVRQPLDAYYARALEQFALLLEGQYGGEPHRLRKVATLMMVALEGAYLLERVSPVAAEDMADLLEQTALHWLDER